MVRVNLEYLQNGIAEVYNCPPPLISSIINETASGAVTNASTIASWNFGQIIIFFLALGLLTAVVGMVYRAVKRG